MQPVALQFRKLLPESSPIRREGLQKQKDRGGGLLTRGVQDFAGFSVPSVVSGGEDDDAVLVGVGGAQESLAHILLDPVFRAPHMHALNHREGAAAP